MSKRRLVIVIVGGLLFAAVCSVLAAQRPAASASVTLFEGARLIAGDGNAPIENSAFIVENNRFTRVGRKGEVAAPSGAARIDLTGKTVIPALIDAHSHIGYMKNLTSGAQNYTRDNILDHMYRFAYFGVAASQAISSGKSCWLGNTPRPHGSSRQAGVCHRSTKSAPTICGTRRSS